MLKIEKPANIIKVFHFRSLYAILLLFSLNASAQIGEHRDDFAIGFSGGMNLSSVNFNPAVQQQMLKGITGGVVARYTCEKYFSTICSIQGEINFSQIGWKEDIKTIDNEPVINQTTGVAEDYSRTLTYIQVPFLAHLAWGREKKGINFFFNAGPQFGFLISEKTKKTFEMDNINFNDRASSVVAQDTMSVENSFDYGITAGVGLELSFPKVGHFTIEGRYYYGLGNIYGDSKRDYFGGSNHSVITIKAAYLFDFGKK